MIAMILAPLVEILHTELMTIQHEVSIYIV